jgi:hypothetical protein
MTSITRLELKASTARPARMATTPADRRMPATSCPLLERGNAAAAWGARRPLTIDDLTLTITSKRDYELISFPTRLREAGMQGVHARIRRVAAMTLYRDTTTGSRAGHGLLRLPGTTPAQAREFSDGGGEHDRTVGGRRRPSDRHHGRQARGRCRRCHRSLLHLLQLANPTLRGIIFDRPNIVDDAVAHTARRGLAEH